jgi:hypothetical protein
MKKMSEAIGEDTGHDIESMMGQAEESKKISGNGETTAGIDSL